MMQHALRSLAIAVLYAVPTMGAVLVSDGFETSTHATGNRTVATSTGIAFYTRYTTTGTASIVSDATMGTKVLSIADTDTSTSTAYPVIGKLPTTLTLNSVNDRVTLSFRFRYVNSSSSTAAINGFRFGLSSSAGTAVTADGQTTSDDDQGYYAGLGFGGSAPKVNEIFYNEAGGQGQFFSGSDRTSFNASAVTGTAINDANVHTASLTLTRTSTTALRLSLVLDGATAITGDSSAPLRTTFDEIGFGGGFTNPGQAFMVDDVVVNYTPIPEPAAAILLGLALPLALRRRR